MPGETPLERVARIVSEHGGIALEQDGGLVMLDRLGRRPCRVRLESAATADVAQRIGDYLNRDTPLPRSLIIEIHVLINAIDEIDGPAAIERVLESWRHIECRVTIHFARETRNWVRLIEWLAGMRRSRMSRRSLRLVVRHYGNDG